VESTEDSFRSFRVQRLADLLRVRAAVQAFLC
jgi:hypothetical protein